MTAPQPYFKRTVTALIVSALCASASIAQEATPEIAPDAAPLLEPGPTAPPGEEPVGPVAMTDLLNRLANAETAAAGRRIEREIRLEWSKSGSPAMDLLLKRGNDALEVGDVEKAIDHFTALTDHAPDFAEGWHGLAQAYYRRELYGIAMDALQRVLAINPDHFGAMRGVAAVLEQVGRPDEAYEVYSRVHDMHPTDEDVNGALDRLKSQVTGRTL